VPGGRVRRHADRRPADRRWLEDTAGNYVDTIYITRKTGSYGLGNRPGIMEFNSGPWWPYGRRVTTFPVWAHRHGMTFPLVEFQDGNDDNLSHALGESSRERFFCRPIRPDEDLWDATSCASTVYTDKGVLSGDGTSLYPPRSDVTFDASKDDPSVETMAELNPFDAVSNATPIGGDKFTGTWAVPTDGAERRLRAVARGVEGVRPERRLRQLQPVRLGRPAGRLLRCSARQPGRAGLPRLRVSGAR
jgi:hypothetical protein